MKVLIVEDETAAYEILVDMLSEINPAIEVLANTESVGQTVEWLGSNPAPDLILMDIHLSDGSAFIIFDRIAVDVPVIFTTAYDQYAIEAFKVNSIDYLLKPIKTTELDAALHKFSRWSGRDINLYLSKMSAMTAGMRYQDKFLIPVKDQLIPVGVREIAFFYTTDKSTFIYLQDGRQLIYNKTLDQIYAALNPADFYRANKQFIIARTEVKNITIWFDSRLLLSLNTTVPEPVYISKNKAADFKAWVVSG